MSMQIEQLWNGTVPGSVGDQPQDRPVVEVYHASRADGSAMIILPGGGYIFHADYEAEPIARWLGGLGVTGIVLKYRLAPRYRHPAPFQDACRAVRLVRARAGQWGLDPKRVGVMGFSAGGHLAAHVATKGSAADPEAADEVDRQRSRPDLCVLLYPVITFSSASSHAKSPEYLLGAAPTPAQVEELSVEKHVNDSTPPTFIYHASGDDNVPVTNAFLYAEALRGAGVPFEMHLYDRVAHGVGLAARDPVLRTWPRLCATWMAGKGWGHGDVE